MMAANSVARAETIIAIHARRRVPAGQSDTRGRRRAGSGAGEKRGRHGGAENYQYGKGAVSYDKKDNS